jgi:hypothetical protein
LDTDGEVVRAGFERKYLVPECDSEALLLAVGQLLRPDPYGARYTVTSLYLDTPDLASYRRELLGKWRLRRYGASNVLFAEFKAKPEPGKVHKRRSELPLEKLETLPGWFAKSVRKQSLAPTRLVTYTRDAFVGTLGGEEVRLTLDHDVRASKIAEYRLLASESISLTEARILEIKFENAIPEVLERLTERLGLLPESFSKYRAAIEKAG